MKKKVLYIITYISVLLFIVFGAMLDSDTYIPAVICLVSGLWLLLFIIANERRFTGYE